MRPAFFCCTAPLFAFAFTLLGATPEARAGLALAVDGNAGAPLVHDPLSKFGFGLSGRLGFRIDIYDFSIGPLYITPEIGGGYWTFGDTEHPTRVFGGGRIGLGKEFQGVIFGHAGYGLVKSVQNFNFEGFTADGGIAFEYSPIPTLGFGVHGSYITNKYTDDQKSDHNLSWINFGLHLTVNI